MCGVCVENWVWTFVACVGVCKLLYTAVLFSQAQYETEK